MTIALFCLAWGVLAFYFVLLVCIGAKPVPTSPSVESGCEWAYQLRTTKAPHHTGSTFVLNPRRSSSL
jgi:hypothetical protein